MLRFPFGFLLIFVGLDCWAFSHDAVVRVHGTVFGILGALLVAQGYLAVRRGAE